MASLYGQFGQLRYDGVDSQQKPLIIYLSGTKTRAENKRSQNYRTDNWPS